jgi:hypothetical protein
VYDNEKTVSEEEDGEEAGAKIERTAYSFHWEGIIACSHNINLNYRNTPQCMPRILEPRTRSNPSSAPLPRPKERAVLGQCPQRSPKIISRIREHGVPPPALYIIKPDSVVSGISLDTRISGGGRGGEDLLEAEKD